jgi:hypothetical protein
MEVELRERSEIGSASRVKQSSEASNAGDLQQRGKREGATAAWLGSRR